jgi:hypothetical protein
MTIIAKFIHHCVTFPSLSSNFCQTIPFRSMVNVTLHYHHHKEDGKNRPLVLSFTRDVIPAKPYLATKTGSLAVGVKIWVYKASNWLATPSQLKRFLTRF